MPLLESCQDCDWEERWKGGSASDDPGLEHAKLTGHTVRTSAVPEKESPDSAVEELKELDRMTLNQHTHVATVEAKMLFNAEEVDAEAWGENVRGAVKDLLSDVPATVQVSTEKWSLNTATDRSGSDENTSMEGSN